MQCAGLSLLWTVHLDTDVQVEADILIRILEKELRLEKDMWPCTPLLPSGLADKVGEQDNTWRFQHATSQARSAQTPTIKVLALETKPD